MNIRRLMTTDSHKYLENCLDTIEKEYGPLREYNTPVANGDRPELDESPHLEEERHRKYQRFLGVGQWLVQIGRMDIAFVICSLSRFAAAPREGHLHRVIRVFGYLKRHKDFHFVVDSTEIELDNIDYFEWTEDVLRLYGSSPTEKFVDPDGTEIGLTMFVDADHGHDQLTSRSVTGYIAFLGSTPVSWKCSRQGVVSTSTYAAELLALRDAVEETLNLVAMVRSFGVGIRRKPIVFVDNCSVLLATKPENELKKKHLVIAYNFVREAAAHGKVRYAYVPSDMNLADLFTKPLARVRFEMLKNMIPQDSQRLSAVSENGRLSASEKTNTTFSPVHVEQVALRSDRDVAEFPKAYEDPAISLDKVIAPVSAAKAATDITGTLLSIGRHDGAVLSVQSSDRRIQFVLALCEAQLPPASSYGVLGRPLLGLLAPALVTHCSTF
eukprot:scaffold1618_cov158-Pinguiococcus_pyrenoidosus.AAC.2